MASRSNFRSNQADPEAPGRARWLPPVLVTASWDGVAAADVEPALRPRFDPRKVLISGDARGGDHIVESLWQVWGGDVDRHAVSPLAWQRSRGAGYDRKAEIVAKAAARGGECVAIIARSSAECGDARPHGTHGAAADARERERRRVFHSELTVPTFEAGSHQGSDTDVALLERQRRFGQDLAARKVTLRSHELIGSCRARTLGPIEAAKDGTPPEDRYHLHV